LPCSNPERGYYRFACPHQIRARTRGADATAANPGAFDEQNDSVGEQVRLRCAGGATKHGQTTALADLELVNQVPTWMTMFR
jgi:hypothetical protein